MQALASVLVAAFAASPAPVGADAVWTPPEEFLEGFHAACDRRGDATFGACFLERMAAAGATPAALAFARRVDAQGYLSDFEDAGRVDLAFVEFPFRANENQLCFLVNGSVPMLDVDDLSRLDRRAFLDDPDYAVIIRAHPKVQFFPGPRSGPHRPSAVALANGHQGFLVSYSLRDGCHACRIVGEAQLRFDFDADGQYLGVRLRRIQRIRP